jgi:osmotically-inducible protein OsmY
MISNEELTTNVSAELLWDPKVDSAAIAVTANDGTVTLRGTVGSFREKRQAKKAAERVYGVVDVKNDLKVELMVGDDRDDADLRGDVLRAITLDTLIPSTVDAVVYDGYVTLKGTAEWQYQRDEAELVSGNIRGVVEVDDQIELTGPPPDSGDVKNAITSAIKRNAKLDADALTVETSNGTVTVKGKVKSWAEHDEAIDAAWAAPGVRSVDDRMTVAY